MYNEEKPLSVETKLYYVTSKANPCGQDRTSGPTHQGQDKPNQQWSKNFCLFVKVKFTCPRILGLNLFRTIRYLQRESQKNYPMN